MSFLRSNHDYYEAWASAVEEVFGRAWLEKKLRLLGGGARVHPIVPICRAAREWLKSAKVSGKADFSLELALYFDMGQSFHATKDLPGFAQAFQPKRLKGPAWQDDCYVAHVASLALRSGYLVSFVPTESEAEVRTPDLQIQRGTQTLFVECKKKAFYVRPGDADAAWPSLEDALGQLHEQIRVDYEVLVACIGRLDPNAVAAISAAARSVVENEQEGQILVPEYDAIILIKKSPMRPPGLEGAWIPAWQNPGSAHIKVSVDSAGAATYGPLFRCCLYLLDAHRSSQILSSLRDARGQIPHETSGLVYVAIDTDRIPETDHDLYVSVLATWLRRELARAENARVLAVVLTGGIARIDVTPNGAFHQTLSRMLVVRNPNASQPFVVPGGSMPPDA